jgi:hypothetical protein
METALIVVAVLFAVLILGALVAAAGWVYFDTRKRQRLTSDVMSELAKQCSLLNGSLSEIAKMPGYLDGLVKVCGDQVIQVAEMRELVERFRLSLFGPEKTRKAEDKAAFQAYSDEAADDSFEIQQMVEAGFAVEEAKEKVANARRAGRFTLG